MQAVFGECRGFYFLRFPVTIKPYPCWKATAIFIDEQKKLPELQGLSITTYLNFNMLLILNFRYPSSKVKFPL